MTPQEYELFSAIITRLNKLETIVGTLDTTESGGVTDHGALTGLADDDHSQYHNDSRGDARYYREDEHINASAGAGDAGKPIVLDAAGHVDATMINDGDIDHGSVGGLGDDDHPQYHNDARGDARYYREDEHINASAGAGDAGKPIVLDAAGHVDATMINDGDIDHGSVGGLGDDDHSQYLRADGTRALTAEWDIGEDMAILAERFKARDSEGILFQDDGGNFGFKVLDGGGFNIFSLVATPIVLFETLTSGANIKLQITITRATATSNIQGGQFDVRMSGRVGTTCLFGFATIGWQGRNNQTILYRAMNNDGLTVTTVTQTSTTLTLTFDLVPGGNWNEFSGCILLTSPASASWTITCSQVA